VLQFLAIAILHFTVSAFEADTSQMANGCDPGASLEHVKSLRLYRMVCYQEPPVREFVRERPTRSGPDTLQVDDSRCISYFVTVVDSAGNESCERGATVGVAAVGVGTIIGTPQRELYDLAGRKVQGIPKSGVYFQVIRSGGKVVKRIVVIR
jgi:hypothetical protein